MKRFLTILATSALALGTYAFASSTPHACPECGPVPTCVPDEPCPEH